MNYKRIIFCILLSFSISTPTNGQEIIKDSFSLSFKENIKYIVISATVGFLTGLLLRKILRPVFDINTPDHYGCTRLYRACIDTNLEQLKILLAYPNIDPNFQDQNGWTVLHHACINTTPLQLDAIKLLLAHPNIDPNIKNKNGWTPLYISSLDSSPVIVNLLLIHPRIDTTVDNARWLNAYGDYLEIGKISETITHYTATEKKHYLHAHLCARASFLPSDSEIYDNKLNKFIDWCILQGINMQARNINSERPVDIAERYYLSANEEKTTECRTKTYRTFRKYTSYYNSDLKIYCLMQQANILPDVFRKIMGICTTLTINRIIPIEKK